MPHEIMEHDGLVLTAVPAWHGLGVVVKDAPTPVEALKIAKLDWDVCQAPMQALLDDGDELMVEGYQMNYRSDTKHQLGVVGTGYKPIQNRELAEFSAALAEGGDVVKIESAGSIRNGQKIWFLLRGESFSVRGVDEVAPYILVSNGHDGGTALQCTPTTVRVVCSNTLHAVIGDESAGFRQRAQPARFVARHTQTIAERVEEAKRALGMYGTALAATRDAIDQLAAKDVTREDVRRFFLECYTRDFGAIPTNPINRVEENARDRAMDASNEVFRLFDEGRELAGTTAWGAANSYSAWLQHRPTRFKDAAIVRDRWLDSTLFGVDAQRTIDAFATALSL